MYKRQEIMSVKSIYITCLSFSYSYVSSCSLWHFSVCPASYVSLPVPYGYLGLASTVVALLGIAVLVTYSPQNGVILLVIAFLVSPLGLPMAAAWLVGKVQDLRFAIQDAVYG